MSFRGFLILTFFITSVLISVCFENASAATDEALYAIADGPTPVFNSYDISGIFGGKDGRTLKMDDSGLIRELEYIALEGAVFDVREMIDVNGVRMLRVSTEDYPVPDGDLFIDSRFVRIYDVKPEGQRSFAIEKDDIVRRLRSTVGNKYVWGGNVESGVPELLEYYAPVVEIPKALRDKWMLKGMDCSGILYYATNGQTPRNTASLLRFGRPVHVFGLADRDIKEKLRPLDLIVWNGHVIIVLDEHRVIESRVKYPDNAPGGVRIRPIMVVLRELRKKRSPADEYYRGKYVIRRWYGDRYMEAQN